MTSWFEVLSPSSESESTGDGSTGAGAVGHAAALGTQVAERTRPGARRRRIRIAVFAGVGVFALGASTAAAAGGSSGNSTFGSEQVGQQDARGILLPDNQRVSPYGDRTLIDNGRLLASTISPDGTHLAASTYEHGTGFLSIFDLRSNKLLQQIGTGKTGDAKIGDGTVAADGPVYSPDGKSLWFPQTADLLKFTLNTDGSVAPAPVNIALKGTGSTGPTAAYLPSGLAFYGNGRYLLAALNGANTLAMIDTTTNAIVTQIPTGVAPRQVVVSGNQVFVSNEGGRPTVASDPSTNLTDGTPVVADPSTGGVTNGTVTVINAATQKVTTTIKVGLQPTAMSLSGNTLLVANSNDDSFSIIDTDKRQVTATVNTNPLPGSTVGSYPNAITMPDPDHILVSVGRDNAIVAYRFNGNTSPVQYLGLIPTDWYPVGVQYDAPLGKYVVTNDKGIGARGPASTITEGPDANPATGLNTYDDTGSLTTFAPPKESQLSKLTHQVFVNNDWQKLLQATPLGRSTAKPVAIPKNLGDPSAIKHVFLIIKENRTYDQVLGDIDKGNSDPTKTQFGYSVTPNQHALANTFGLFDNFYDEGTLSADGHNWLVQADANDYVEKEFGAFYRSYPAQGGDALAYQRDGFLWNAAAAAGQTVSNFGEYNNFFTADNDPNRPTWAQWYQDSQILEGKASGPLPVPIDKYKTYADIPSLNAITDPTYPKFDTDVPDQYRTDIWLKSFQQSEKTGQLANLSMMWVPDDHTAGTSGKSPYPTAAVADNDLAVGRMIDAISHSQFWSSSAVFVLEDDSQAGVDHVDGHRSPLYIASPYANRDVIDSTYYSQLNVVKTIEQILGIKPMNQEDRAAEPMFDAFTDQANTTPFTARPNQIPLTYGLAPSAAAPPSSNGPAADAASAQAPAAVAPASVTTASGAPSNGAASAAAAPASAVVVPAAEQAVAGQWQVWSSHQLFSGPGATEDASNPAQLNRLDWYASTGWTRPYPGDTKVLGPYEVPGWQNPPADLG